MVPASEQTNGADRADLVAYLDGELTGPQAQVIAGRAARDEATRREVEALRETWGLLDLLPRPRASEDLGTRTLTAINDPVASASPARSRNRSRILGLVGLSLASAGLGYWVTGRAWEGRDARLIRQLSLVEHLNEYQAIGSAEFLRLLDESDIFDDAD